MSDFNFTADITPPEDTTRKQPDFYCNTSHWQASKHGRMEQHRVFSKGSSPVRLTEEQENEIAEAVYDWWISGKGYRQWRAERTQWGRLDFQPE